MEFRPAALSEPVKPPADDSPTPGTETRLCEGECGCRYGTNDPDRTDCACDGPCCNADDALWFAAPSPVDTTEPPAEAQQDDERGVVERIASLYRDPTLARFAINDFRDWLAARPSADTETVILASTGDLRPGDVVQAVEWDDGTEYSITVDRAAR